MELVLDSIGDYDAVRVSRLLPLLKKYKVSAYIQGHRHSLEHVQGPGSKGFCQTVHYSLSSPAVHPLLKSSTLSLPTMFIFSSLDVALS